MGVAQGNLLGHGGVDRGDAARCHQGVQGRDVAEADDPLGVVAQGQGGEGVEIVHDAVAAAGAEYGAHIGVGEGGAQVGEALGVGAAEVAVLAKGVGHDVDAVAALAQHGGGRVDDAALDGARRGEDGYLVAGAQRRRVDDACRFLAWCHEKYY